MNPQGFAGSMLQMLNHGVSTGALFLLVGVIYERRHTRLIADFGGLWKPMPVYSAIFLVVMLSSIGLPGTNGFVGEFLVLLGTFRANCVVGRDRRDRRDPLGLLHAVDVPARDLRAGHARGEPEPARTSRCASGWCSRRCSC